MLKKICRKYVFRGYCSKNCAAASKSAIFKTFSHHSQAKWGIFFILIFLSFEMCAFVCNLSLSECPFNFEIFLFHKGFCIEFKKYQKLAFQSSFTAILHFLWVNYYQKRRKFLVNNFYYFLCAPKNLKWNSKNKTIFNQNVRLTSAYYYFIEDLRYFVILNHLKDAANTLTVERNVKSNKSSSKNLQISRPNLHKLETTISAENIDISRETRLPRNLMLINSLIILMIRKKRISNNKKN